MRRWGWVFTLMAMSARASAEDDKAPPLRGDVVLIETLVGGAAAAGVFIAGYEYGYRTHGPTFEQASSEGLPERRGLLFGYGGLLVATPAAVLSVGYGLDQRGSIFGALFGDVLGAAVGLTVLKETDNLFGYVCAVGLPVIGTVLGYNIHRDPPPRERPRRQITPTAYVSPDQTLVGIAGSL